MTRIGPCALALVALVSACGNRQPAQPPAQARAPGQTQAQPPSGSPAGAPAPPQAESQEAAAPLAKATVTIYFPSAEGEGLAAEQREIVDTKGAADRGAQIVAALIEGPQTEASLPAVPAGTTLRRLWVREDGTAYADFSEELASGESGGSADELLTVYSIVDSLTSNIPEIHRVGILVAGRELDSFGHLDLRRPFPPDPTLVSSATTAKE
jgi:germination protein M